MFERQAFEGIIIYLFYIFIIILFIPDDGVFDWDIIKKQQQTGMQLAEATVDNQDTSKVVVVGGPNEAGVSDGQGNTPLFMHRINR